MRILLISVILFSISSLTLYQAVQAGEPKKYTQKEFDEALEKKLVEERVKWEANIKKVIADEWDKREVKAKAEKTEEVKKEDADAKLRKLAAEHAAKELEKKRRQMKKRELEIEETVKRSRVMFLPEAERKKALDMN